MLIKKNASPVLVSVLMTAFNREQYIAEAIESVLASDYHNIELIIVDDASTDDTVAIAAAYKKKDHRIRLYVNDTNLGDYPNRNKAASLASGKYLKYVDSDDKVYPHTIGLMVDTMEQYPEAGFGVSSRISPSIKEYHPQEAYHMHFFVRGLLDSGPTATIIHTKRFFESGGFSEIRNVSDLDMWLRMAAKYPVIELPKGLVYWRQHETQEIRLAPEFYLEHGLSIIKKNLLADNCPLDPSDITQIIKKLNRQTAVGILKHLAKSGDIRYFFRLIRSNSM